MREVRVRERKKKWPLIFNRSSQHQITSQREKSPLTPGGETCQQQLNHPRATTSAALNTTSPQSLTCLPFQKKMNILLIFTLIGLVFRFIPAELDGFNCEIIVLNSAFKLEKRGLNDDCDVSPSPTNNTIGVTNTPCFYFSPTGVGLAEFNNLGCEFNVVAAATAKVTIVTDENKNKNIFESGPSWGQNTQTENSITSHPSAPRNNTNDRISPTDVGCCEFDKLECDLTGVLPK